MKTKKPDIIMSKCICEVCNDTYTNYPNWIKSMPNSDEILWHSEIGYNSVTLMAAEYKGRLWLGGYVSDRRYQAYAADTFRGIVQNVGKNLRIKVYTVC